MVGHEYVPIEASLFEMAEALIKFKKELAK
jgi:hypothetical protein